MPIAHYRHATLDCPDPYVLATFYSSLADLEIEPLGDLTPDAVSWMTVQLDGKPVIAFARVNDYVAPTWPTGNVPQQAHLEFSVPDLDKAEAGALAIGARKADFQPDENFRVFLDPAGHPFCLILNY